MWLLLVAVLIWLSGSMSQAGELQGIRGSFFDFVRDPFFAEEKESIRFIPDGLLIIEDGKIKVFGTYESMREKYGDLKITSHSGKLIMPGFIDCHIHYPQTRMVAAYGNQLLEWLNASVWPEEIKFRNKEYARQVASFFLDEMLRCGTTTVQSYTTTFPDSVDAFFEEASKRNMRVIAGLTGIDRKGQAPDDYRDTAESFYVNSKKLIQKWHGKERNLYAVTPRFAAGSTEQQLRRAGELRKQHPDVYVNTHLSENPSEIRLVAKLFPMCTDYLNVYERFGLVGPRCNFGHAVHLSDSEFERLSRAGASIAFCPSSNLFLGSGLFKIGKAKSSRTPVRVGLGTDVGGGNNFSQLLVLKDAYKVGMLQDYKISAFKGLYLATRGGADALYLEDKLGSFDPGKEADFVVFDVMATPELAFRNQSPEIRSLDDLAFKTFGLMMLGDSRAVCATYVAGKRLYEKKQ